MTDRECKEMRETEEGRERWEVGEERRVSEAIKTEQANERAPNAA